MEPHKFYGAGVLPFTKYKNTLYFLIGRNKKENTWSDFGGCCERSDNGSHTETAAREFYEETIGSVQEIDTVKKILSDGHDSILINTQSSKGMPYKMYIMYIPYKCYRTHFLNNYKFGKYAQVDQKFLEKDDIQWISLETVYYIINFEHETDIKLRKPFIETLKKNFHDIKNACTNIYKE